MVWLFGQGMQLRQDGVERVIGVLEAAVQAA